MEIKTSKIKEITSIGDPWGQYKNMYHKLIMENGDKLDIGKIEKLTQGMEINYYFTDELGQQEYTKAKTPSKMEMQRGVYNPQNNRNTGKSDEKREKSIVRCALIKASACYHQGRNTTGNDVLADAKLWESWCLGQDDNNEVPF